MSVYGRPSARVHLGLKVCLVVLLLFGLLQLGVGNNNSANAQELSVLINDDFENGTAADWTVNDGNWSVTEDPNGNKAYMQSVTSDGGTVLRGDAQWQDYTFEADIEPVSYNGGGNSLLFRYSENGFYLVYMTETSIKLLVKSNGISTLLGGAAYTFAPGVKNRVKVDVQGDEIRVYVDDEANPLLQAVDNTIASGGIGLQTWMTSAKFDNILVKGFNSEPVGSVLINDDFENGSAADWTVNDGTWSVTEDTYGNKAYLQSNTSDGGTVLRGDAQWEDYTFEADIEPVSYNGGGNSLLFRYSASGFYLVYMTETTIKLLVKSSGGQTLLGSADYSFAPGVSNRVKVDVRGDNIRVYVNDDANPLLEAVDNTSTSGGIGLQTWLTSAKFDNILVKGLYSDPVGSVLINDDFENGTAANWTVNDGDWSVTEDSNGNKAYMQSVTSDGGTVLSGNAQWKDYTFEADIEPVSYNGGGNSLLFRYSENGFYLVYMTETSIKLLVKSNGISTVLGSAAYTFAPGVKNQVKVDVQGDKIRVYVNDEVNPLLQAVDNTIASGGIGLQTWMTSAKFDNILVKGSYSPPPVWSVLINDNFENGNAADWTVNDGIWSVREDPNGNKAYLQSGTSRGGTVLRGNAQWQDYTFEADIEPVSYNGGGNSLLFRYSTSGFYLVYMTETSIKLLVKSNGKETVLGSAAYHFAPGVKNRVKVDVQGDKINVYVNDEANPLLQAVDNTIASGGIGLQTWMTSTKFDNILVKGPYSPPDDQPDLPTYDPSAELTIISGESDLTIQGMMSSPTLDPQKVYFRIFGKFGDYSEEITDIVAPLQNWVTVSQDNPVQQDGIYQYSLPAFTFEPMPGAVTYTAKVYGGNGKLLGESSGVFALYEQQVQ